MCTKPTATNEDAKDPALDSNDFVWEEDSEGEGSKTIGKTEAMFQGVGGMTFSAEMAEKWLRGEREPSQDDCSLESLEEKVTELERFSTARFYALGVEEDVGKVTDEIRKRLREKKLDDNRMADDELHRFYLARGRDMDNTVHQVSEVLEWRITNQPNGHFELEEFEIEYKRNKVVFLGYDRLGRACLLVRAKMHDGTLYPKKTDECTQTLAKFVVHVFDSVIVQLDKEHTGDRFVMIVDLEDSNKALARGASIETLLFASKFFPERLGAVWVLNGTFALLPTM